MSKAISWLNAIVLIPLFTYQLILQLIPTNPNFWLWAKFGLIAFGAWFLAIDLLIKKYNE